MSKQTETHSNKPTPWGPAQFATYYDLPGIVFYSTAGHGGFHLSPERQAELLAKFPGFVPFRSQNVGWYEEDVDATAVILTWPELFPGMDLKPIQACFDMYCRPRMRPQRTICRVEQRAYFNEADCGGAFDGFTVSSDADPGL